MTVIAKDHHAQPGTGSCQGSLALTVIVNLEMLRDAALNVQAASLLIYVYFLLLTFAAFPVAWDFWWPMSWHRLWKCHRWISPKLKCLLKYKLEKGRRKLTKHKNCKKMFYPKNKRLKCVHLKSQMWSSYIIPKLRWLEDEFRRNWDNCPIRGRQRLQVSRLTGHRSLNQLHTPHRFGFVPKLNTS